VRRQNNDFISYKITTFSYNSQQLDWCNFYKTNNQENKTIEDRHLKIPVNLGYL